jgi:hypothetical protein
LNDEKCRSFTSIPREKALFLLSLLNALPNLLPIIAIVYATNWPTTAEENKVLQTALVPANASNPNIMDTIIGSHVAMLDVLVNDLIDERRLEKRLQLKAPSLEKAEICR